MSNALQALLERLEVLAAGAESVDTEELAMRLSERQKLLDALQAADRSTLTASERERIGSCLKRVQEQDSRVMVALEARMAEICEQKAGLVDARKTARAYAGSEEARPRLGSWVG